MKGGLLVRRAQNQNKPKVLARLRSIEGHIRGVREMLEANQYCIDVLRQIRAVEAALGRASALLLEGHLNHCVTRAIRSSDVRERERVVAELMDVFEAGRSL